MQKNLTLRLTVLCAVSSLAACGSSGTATTTEPSDASAVTTTSADSASTAVAVDGFTFAPPAGDYSVVFPIEPTANEQMVPLADGSTVPFTLYVTDSADMSRGTGALTYPPGMVVSLEGLRDGTIAGVSGTQTSSEPISLQGREGLQFTASMQNGEVTYLARAYADGDTVYQVIAVTAGEVAFDDPRVAAFFDSFRFTVDK